MQLNELKDKIRRTKYLYDSLEQHCRMDDILKLKPWDQDYGVAPWGNYSGMKSQLKAFKQICHNKMGAFGFTEKFKFNITFRTDFGEGQIWFLKYILLENNSYVDPGSAVDICGKLIKFMEDSIEIDFLYEALPDEDKSIEIFVELQKLGGKKVLTNSSYN